MKSRTFSVTVLLATLLLVQCSNYNDLTKQTEVLFRTDWKLTELQGQALPESAKTRFRFTPGQIAGTTGCNQLSAGFVAGKHQSVRFSPEASTRMACPDDLSGTLETKFLDALSKSTKWKMSGGELWLGDETATLVKLHSLQ